MRYIIHILHSDFKMRKSVNVPNQCQKDNRRYWQEMRFKLLVNGKLYAVNINGENTKIQQLLNGDETLPAHN